MGLIFILPFNRKNLSNLQLGYLNIYVSWFFLQRLPETAFVDRHCWSLPPYKASKNLQTQNFLNYGISMPICIYMHVCTAQDVGMHACVHVIVCVYEQYACLVCAWFLYVCACIHTRYVYHVRMYTHVFICVEYFSRSVFIQLKSLAF